MMNRFICPRCKREVIGLGREAWCCGRDQVTHHPWTRYTKEGTMPEQEDDDEGTGEL
jgi:hypothetical protein